MRKTFLIITALFSIITVYGQNELYMLDGDTLKGEITILYPEDRFEEIIFESGDDKRRMKAFEFKGFSQDGEIYRSVKSGEKYRIMQLVEPGYLSMYRFRIDNSYAYNGLYLYRRDGQGIEVPGMMFKKTMMNFMADCNAIEASLKDNKYKRRDIEELVADYNACIEAKTDELEEMRNETFTKPVSSTPALSLAEELLDEARAIGDDDLESMLNDVVEKLGEGSAVPAYLKKAISTHVDESHELHSEITRLLNQI